MAVPYLEEGSGKVDSAFDHPHDSQGRYFCYGQLGRRSSEGYSKDERPLVLVLKPLLVSWLMQHRWLRLRYPQIICLQRP